MERKERPLDRRLGPTPLSVVLERVAAPPGLSFPSVPPAVLSSGWKPPRYLPPSTRLLSLG